MFGTGKGPRPAKYLIVGEAFGQSEAMAGLPFVGTSGKELDKMLSDAKILHMDCRFTNVVNQRPPGNDITHWFCSSATKAKAEGVEKLFGKYPKDIVLSGLRELASEIVRTKPRVIIPVGNYALWALTGEFGIGNWRGSLLDFTKESPVYDACDDYGDCVQLEEMFGRIAVVPTYHPAGVLRQWSWRHIVVHDLRYAAENSEVHQSPPDYKFLVEPSYEQTIDVLTTLLGQLNALGNLRLAVDIETRQGQIACIGLAWTKLDAICIPFMSNKKVEGYWSLEQETEIVHLLARILTHEKVQCIWQNGMYDVQYIARNWHFIPNVTDDTMLMQHAAFPGLPKGLDFLRSMYCSYRRFWKNESKEWITKMDETILWRYNCTDCVVTYEIREALHATLKHLNVLHIYEHSMSLYEPVLFMMFNGIKVDTIARDAMVGEMLEASVNLDSWIEFVLGEPFNVNSPPQMRRLFYDEFKVPVIRDRKSGKPTLNAAALEKIYSKYTLLQPLIDRMLLRRKVSTYYGTFLKPAIDPDNRDRCSYNIGGTETGRFSSSGNAFGRGRNLENIPRPPDKGEVETTPIMRIPNVRSLYVPDPGFIIADFDLDRADAHIVAWEANDESLKELFRSGVDVHSANAEVIGTTRQLAKTFVHGTNYGGSGKTMAGTCGISKAAAERGQYLWFNEHPNIREWHERVERELMLKRCITTVFGRVRYYFDRIDINIRNEALAYLGQSPVADVINKGLRNVYVNLPWCQLLLQNHDSIVVQFPNSNVEERIWDITEQLLIPIPYDDPLTIPVGCKIGERSWGSLEEVA